MMQKTVLKESTYSKKDFDRLEAACRKLEKEQKSPSFRKAVKEFIKESTSKSG